MQKAFLAVPFYVRHLSPCWESVLYLGKRAEYTKNVCFNDAIHGPNRFFYVKSGLLCSFNVRRTDLEEIDFFIDEGSLFRETRAIANFPQCPGYYRCCTDLVVYSFDSALLSDRDFMHEHWEIISNCMFSIAVKSMMAQECMHIMKMNTNKMKIAYYIYSMYKYGNYKLCIKPPINQTMLSKFLGINLITTNKIIKWFKDKGIIECYTTNQLKILDINALCAVFTDPPQQPLRPNMF